ncbi:MAG: hypothetical protein ABR576_10140 [Thermoanaerobaculia bacterium]
MSLRRSLASAGLAAAALLPPVLWLWPALALRRAPSFRDQGDFFFPLKLYTADRIAAGSIPLWNPLSGGGEPWLANAQSGVFYPPTAFFLLPSAALAAGLYLLLHFAIAGWGAWKFLKAENVSDAGALLGTVACAACGFSASLSAYWNHFGAWAYLPAVAALARSGLPTRMSVLGLGGLLGLQAMAGSPEISAATVLAGGVLLLLPRPENPPRLVPLGMGARFLRFAAAGMLGAALAGWVLVPLAELLFSSDRRVPLPAAERENGAVTLQGFSSLAGISPEASGTPYLASLYASPLLLMAAAAAPVEPQRRRLVLLLALLGVASVIAAAAGPPSSWLRALPPLDRWRYPAKALALSSFSLAMLGGLGADSLAFLRPKGRARIFLAALGAGALALVLLSSAPPLARGAAATGVLALLACLLPLRSFSVSAALSALAAVSLAVALAAAGRPLFRFVPETEIRAEPPSADRLRQVAGRVLTPPMSVLARHVLGNAGADDAAILRRQREALLGYTNLLLRVPTIRTAAALQTAEARTIADSIDASPNPGETAGRAGARALWTPLRPAQLPSRKLGEFFRAPLERYRPRIAYAGGYRIEPDAALAWRQVAAAKQARWDRVVLDREPEFKPAPAARPMLVARLAEDAPERVTVELTANSPGILVLADLWYPGWTAEADGRAVPLLRADGVFRAVSLAAGTHRVTFRYRPLSVYAGAALSGIAVLTLIALFWSGEPVPVGRRR